MERVIELIAPKICKTVLKNLEPVLQNAKSQGKEEFSHTFSEALLQNKVAVYFDDQISLEELTHQLRMLIIDNHIDVSVMADDLDENEGADGMLGIAAKAFKKQGWSIIDFDADPKIYCLSIVPTKSLPQLSKFASENGLYIQSF